MKKIFLSVLVLLFGLTSIQEVSANPLGDLLGPTVQTIKNVPSKIGQGVNNRINGEVNQFFNKHGGNGQLPSGSFSLPDKEEFGKDIAQNTSVRSYVLKVLNFFLSFLGLLAIIMVIYAGFIYLTQAEEGKDKAKGILLYAVVGILVVLVSFALVNTVIQSAPAGDSDRTEQRKQEKQFPTSFQDRGSPGEVLDSVIYTYEKAPSGLFSQTTTSLINTASAQEVLIDRNNIASLIVIKASDFIDTDEAIYVSLEEAKKGLTFEFNARSEVDWDMGDGHTLSTTPGKAFAYTYGQPGIYVVTALGHDGQGQRILQAKAVVVGAQFAQMNLSQNKAPTGREIEFDGNVSDVRGVAGNIIRYTWNCSGGVGCFESLEAPIFSASFNVPGTYTISLEIETSTGLIDATAQQVVITGGEPVAYFKDTPLTTSTDIGGYVFNAKESSSSLGTKKGLTYLWSIGEEQIDTTNPLLEYTFHEKGVYDISLRIREERPGQELYSIPFEKTIEVKTILSVDFSIPESDIFVDSLIHFVPESNDALRYLWDFGDGETSREKLPEHIYKKSGEKVVTLTVQSGTEKQSTQKTIVVRNKYQATTFIKTLINNVFIDSETVIIQKNDIINFYAKSLDKYGKEVPFNHTWYVNGRLVDYKDLKASMDTFGIYVVRLVSVHAKIPDQRAEVSRTVWVQNQKPVIRSASISQGDGLPNGTVKMRVNAIDPEGGALKYVFKAFFQGEEEIAQSGLNPEKLLTLKNGAYTFLVEVQDQEGDKTIYELSDSIRIAGVTNTPPEVDFVVDPIRYHFTTTDFLFEARATDIDEDILYYTWLIDGEIKQEGKDDSFRKVSLNRPGVYTITVRVDDRRGGVVESTKNITVKWDPNIRTEETNTKPTIDLCVDGGSTVLAGQPVSFFSNATDLEKDILEYSWKIGAKNPYASLQNIQHVFDAPGLIPVELQVKDGIATTKDTVLIQVLKKGSILPVSEKKTCVSSNTLVSSLSNKFQNIFKIVPISLQDSFLSRIGWGDFFTPLQENKEELSSLKRLHALGLVGLKTGLEIEDILVAREASLLRLLEKVEGTSAEAKVQTELNLIESDPVKAAQKYVQTLGNSTALVTPTVRVKTGGQVFFTATISDRFESPLLIIWNDGNGGTEYGQHVGFKYKRSGLYLASLTLSDGLTEVQDWIIIQVEK